MAITFKPEEIRLSYCTCVLVVTRNFKIVPFPRGGVGVAGWIVDREIRVLFTACITTCGPSDGKEVNYVFGSPGSMSGNSRLGA